MYIPIPDVSAIVNEIEKKNVGENETVFVMLAENQHPDIHKLIAELNKLEIDFFGGIFPGIIHGSQKYDSGALIHILPVTQKPMLFQDIHNSRDELEKSLPLFKSLHKKNATALIIVDGMSSNISAFLSSIFNLFADSVKYIGSGAGFADMQAKPCIFTPEGFFDDSAVVALLNLKCNMGVHHGWKKDIGPLIVTKSENNIIKELNWKNALHTYSEALKLKCDVLCDAREAYDLLSHYPFGIYIENHEDLVREVFKISDDGELICAGEVPENAVLSILKGTKKDLIAAAEKSVEDCFRDENIPAEHCLIIDCVGRSAYLQEEFKEELEAVKTRLESRNIQAIPEGVLSTGEIASVGGDILEYLNKTIVFGVLYESRD
ncbi:MAG: FIST N-terminal domain-containing protein [Methanolobus sp.]